MRYVFSFFFRGYQQLIKLKTNFVQKYFSLTSEENEENDGEGEEKHASVTLDRVNGTAFEEFAPSEQDNF